jgi:hypothetical protein
MTIDYELALVRAVAELDVVLRRLIGHPVSIVGSWLPEQPRPTFALTGVLAGPREPVQTEAAPAYATDRRVVAELAVRTTQVRWERVGADLEVPEPGVGWRGQLAEDAPEGWLRAGVISVGPGWADLLRAAVELIHEIPGAAIETSDLKQKYGSMRWYARCPVPPPRRLTPEGQARIAAILEASGIVSWATCEDCGAPGKLHDDRDWIQVLCGRHHREIEES